MFGKSHKPRGSSTPAQNPASRMRTLFMALTLTLSIGGVSQAVTAQAAPAAATLRFHMLARRLRSNTICVGDNVPIYVRVMRSEMTGNQGDNVQNLPGVRVDASLSNPGIGTLTPRSSYTGWRPTAPGTANFSLHADKVGATTVSFTGTINHIWWLAKLGLPPVVDRRDFVNAQVEIEVEDCSYTVNAVSQWTGPDINYVAMIDQAGMVTDAPGHFTGTATVNWVLSEIPPPDGSCPLQAITPTTEASLTGELVGTDLLVVNIKFQPLEVTWYAMGWILDECLQSGSVTWFPTPDSVRLNIPATGGAANPSQPLLFLSEPSEWDIPGEADITVTRVTGE